MDMSVETALYTTFSRLNDFKEITKMRLALSVVFSSIAGYLLAADTINYTDLFLLTLGGYCLVGASNAFNQVIEKDLDALMQRTKNRPLPSGRMKSKTALLTALSMTILGIAILYNLNWRTAFFGSLSVLLYVVVYTPLKTKTPLAVFVGAFPGAIPFMLGWVAHTNHFGIEPGVLFMLQFFWQFPHFWAIAWMLDEDYKKAGFKMLPTGEKDQGTAFQIIVYTLWMLLISLLPFTHYTGELSLSIYGAIAVVVVGVIMLYFATDLMLKKNNKAAQRLMISSVFYISAVQIIYIIDKFLIYGN
ncbi:MAG: heme o synthase [Flavobacteriaceae bacterium]